jgi:hypothetical protein
VSAGWCDVGVPLVCHWCATSVRCWVRSLGTRREARDLDSVCVTCDASTCRGSTWRRCTVATAGACPGCRLTALARRRTLAIASQREARTSSTRCTTPFGHRRP